MRSLCSSIWTRYDGCIPLCCGITLIRINWPTHQIEIELKTNDVEKSSDFVDFARVYEQICESLNFGFSVYVLRASTVNWWLTEMRSINTLRIYNTNKRSLKVRLAFTMYLINYVKISLILSNFYVLTNRFFIHWLKTSIFFSYSSSAFCSIDKIIPHALRSKLLWGWGGASSYILWLLSNLTAIA